MKYQLLIIVLLVLSAAPGVAGSAATDISGTWKGAIDRPGNSYGPLDITFIIKQEGEKLSGSYFQGNKKGEQQKITGIVKGNKVVISYELNPPAEVKKPGLTVTFNGTLESPNRITGAIGNPYCDGECKWTVTKQKK
ncbi:MAG TPA: hypothetical protein VFV58_29215 [Blastocatellia bacterium]|jgi:hypothetical protein|nr:hypothetical protein [Blastocatellia bacterium]